MTDKEYYKRFMTETIYLWEDERETYVKSVPGADCYAKLPGGEEFKIKPDSDLFCRAFYAKKEVSKKEYDKA